VPVTSLDGPEASRWRLLDFLKLDIEGQELNALLGAKKTIRRHMPIIYLEFQENAVSIVATLWNYGYTKLWTHTVPQDRFPNFANRPLAFDPGPGPVMLLAVPEHRWKDHEGFVKERFSRI